jgi:hypothetical protein
MTKRMTAWALLVGAVMLAGTLAAPATAQSNLRIRPVR